MSRADLFETRVETLREEARKLVEWAHANSAYYKKNAPMLVTDIRAFEDCAATLDAFSSGLAVVPPHRAMHMELIRWVQPTADLPDGDEIVLVVVNGAVTRGVLEPSGWYEAGGMRFTHPVQFWAYYPAGPQMHDAMTEEAAA